MTGARWVLPESDAPAEAGLAARILHRRGYRDAEAVHRFLNPSLDDLHDPYLMAGMREAVERLLGAIRGGEKILIYGDYDVDGTSSVAILAKGIELAGGSADFFVPHRLKDGYGMRAEVVEQAARDGVRLIVSVDTGIRAAEVVRRASELGIDVIVTDHHLPEAGLPPATAVLNPNRHDCGYPEKNLCGAGVAFKLVQALLGAQEWAPEKVRRMTGSFLKLVAIATVADVVPLAGENRVIVRHGLDGLGSVRNPGLRALLDVAGFPAGRIPNATNVAFRIAPRMNAAGRMDTASSVIEMLLTADSDRARALAEQLHGFNEERQQTEEALTRAILDECLKTPVDDRFALVFCGENWHRGVLGIVASRVVERFHRPTFVLSSEDGTAAGSGRSIPSFHLLEALESMPDLFAKFGGHKHAAGVTLDAARVEEFRERFNSWAAARLTPDDLRPEIEIDAVANLREIDERSAGEIFALAPFGHGNPAPLVAALDVEVAGPPVVWKERHLRVMVRQNGRTLALKAWNFASRAEQLAAGTHIDAAFVIEEDSYSAARGYPGWCAVLREFRPAAAVVACGL